MPGRPRRRISILLSLLPVAIPLPAEAPSPSPPILVDRSPPAVAPPSLPVPPRSAPERPDRGPDEVAERAVDAQRDFERLRRRHLPLAWPRYERCDEVVGRFCLWHEDRDWEPPPEDPEVTRAREELLAVLAAAAESLPAGPEARIGELPALEWVEGQRARYLVEAGRPEEARRAVRRCRAREAWCRALEGFVEHAAGNHRRAGEAFARALAAFPEEERCRWNDLSPVLDGAGRDRYSDLPCREGEELEARFWWLADPLWIVPGEDRRTEHYSRHVLDRIQEEAASGYGLTWGSDLRELLIRYGWPAGWERIRPRPGSLSAGGTSYMARDPVGARRWAPRGEWLAPSAVVEPGSAEEEVHEPRSHYAASHVPELRSLSHQLARFRRGRETVVVVGWERPDLPGEEAGTGGSVGDGGRAPEACPGARVGLVVARGPGEDPGIALGTGDREGGALALRVGPPPGPAAEPGTPGSGAAPAAPPEPAAPVASVEWLCPGRLAARSRYTLDLPAGGGDGVGLSDILLLRGEGEAGGSLPRTLAGAARRARGSLRVRPGERVPLYWEVYGAPEEVEVSVSLVREGGGFLRKVGALLGLVGDRRPSAELRWRDGAAGTVVRRAAALGVPEEVEEGEYRLELRVTSLGGPPLRASRLLRVEGREE